MRRKAFRFSRMSIEERGWKVVNVDAVVVADTPRLAPRVPEIRRSLAVSLGIEEGGVSVKGKRAEGLGNIVSQDH